MMEVEMTCVVDTGMPMVEAPWMMIAAVVSAAKPCTGCSFTILCPIVLMMRHPPAAGFHVGDRRFGDSVDVGAVAEQTLPHHADAGALESIGVE